MIGGSIMIAASRAAMRVRITGLLCMLACACRSRDADTAPMATVVAGDTTGSAWGVTLEAAGPVRFGMTEGEAMAAVGTAPDSAAATDSACRYWRPSAAPPGLRFMLENGLVVRADVDSAGITTIGDLGVGSPVDSVLLALGPSLQVAPHKYEWESGWRYLSIGGDSTHRLVFEVDSHVVRTWRVGLLPAVEYVEGCN